MKAALLSVHDKRSVVKFASGLQELGFEIISARGTASVLCSAGIRVVEASDYTGAQELLDGRVKTLHPLVHAGVLFKCGFALHREQVLAHSIKPIDLVAVTLYPFQQVVESGASEVALARAAAKNYAHVAVVTSAQQYEPVLQELSEHGIAMVVAGIRHFRH